MDIILEKALIALGIVVLTLIFVFLPLAFTKVPKHWEIRILSLCNAFAGGVFLAGGFVHLLSETGNMLDESGVDIPDLPYPAFFCLTGFLLVFFLEQVVLSHSHSHDSQESQNKPQPKSQQMKDMASAVTVDVDKNPTEPNLTEPETGREISTDSNPPATTPPTEGVTPAEAELIDEDDLPKKESLAAQIMGMVLVVVLSVHAIVAGLSLGMQTDQKLVIGMFITILSHKWVESFALGANLLRSGFPLKRILIVGSVYSLAIPLGITLGTVIQNYLTGDYAIMATIIATGIGAGTFIYVAIVDILIEEFKPRKDKYLKFFLVLAGLALLSALLIFFDHD